MTFSTQEFFQLTPEQARAALLRDRDVIVVAGAGSGKTRTLVARYLSLLADGLTPAQVVAITFTKKAAREMRSRVRAALHRLAEEGVDAAEQSYWSELEGKIDAARIGTIHSLCAEIIHAHPAEAGIDPDSQVLKEGDQAALRASVIEAALSWAVEQPDLQPLFRGFRIERLRELLGYSLESRLDLSPWLSMPSGGTGTHPVVTALERFAARPDWLEAMDELRDFYTRGALVSDAGETLALQIECLLSAWTAALETLRSQDSLAAAQAFHDLKANLSKRAGRKGSRCKEAVAALRDLHDAGLSWLGKPPDPQAEALSGVLVPLLQQLIAKVHDDWARRLKALRALDFDNLEALALSLLGRPEVRRQWQAEVQALLVDEFQDTNGRQRDLIEALCDKPGKLFVVGDDRQSIYRFRGAEVTIFRQEQARVTRRGGESQSIERTYRAHRALVETSGSLLEKVMGPDRSPGSDRSPVVAEAPYWIPYSPLVAARVAARPEVQGPPVEFIIGQGGRESAAEALALRLHELKSAGEIQDWGQVALLFRASTSFSAYEDVLETAGIPFVTVSGRGFYHRPEVRDVLNLLRGLSDPWDDLAVAGLLRSPAFGLTDAAIYRLRWPSTLPGASREGPRSLRQALEGSLEDLDPVDQRRARWAQSFFRELSPQCDRLPAAALLLRVLEATDYRAILAASGQGRLWRNLDKLVEDAHAAGRVRVDELLEYLQTLRDVGAREGEAAVEAYGAVQLMTVHKAKGLEFDFTVIADAAYHPRERSSPAYRLPEDRLWIRPDGCESEPLGYRLAKAVDNDQELAEEKRLLYVAATRAREKLLVSGHRPKQKRACWLLALAGAAGLDLGGIEGQSGARTIILPGDKTVGVWILPEDGVLSRPGTKQPAETSMYQVDLHLGKGSHTPLFSVTFPGEWNDFPEDRIEGQPIQPLPINLENIPTEAVSRLARIAVQRWQFPGNPRFERSMQAAVLSEGIVNEDVGKAVIAQVQVLLRRLAAHPLKTAVDAATECRGRVPCAHQEDGPVDWGTIDLLYRSPEGWQAVEFRTNRMESIEMRSEDLETAKAPLRRRILAVRKALDAPVQGWVCFLDDQGAVSLFPI